MLPPTIANAADRATRARLEQARNELTEEHLNPLHLQAVQATQLAVPKLGRSHVLRALPRPLPVRPRGARGAVPRLPRLDRAAVRGVDGPPAARTRRGRARGGRAPRRASALPRLGLGRGVPGRPDGAGPPRHAGEPRDRPRRTGQRPPRRRGTADEDPACVLRTDRDPGQGDARDPAAGRPRRLVRPLPRGRAHGALRLHEPRSARGGEAAGRLRGHRGLGDALRPPHRRPRRGSHTCSTSRGRRRSPPRALFSSSSSSAATARSCSTSWSSTPRPTSPSCVRATSSCSGTR